MTVDYLGELTYGDYLNSVLKEFLTFLILEAIGLSN